MGSHLDPRLPIGGRVGGNVVMACIPHATRWDTWLAVGRANDGKYAVWLASNITPIDAELIFGDVAEALRAMLRFARS
jgi:hypothetical protein